MTFDTERYRGHTALCEIDIEGQRRLLNAKVVIAGCGGLASTAISTLAASGAGHLLLVDGDRVETSNLQRQTIHHPSDLGRLKVDSARDKIAALNPDVTVTTIPRFLTADNAREIIGNADIVLDCTDSFTSKATVARACVDAGVPLVTGAVSRFSGQVMTWMPGTACYGCLYGLETPRDNSDTSCAAQGIFSGIVGIVGVIQASEAMKYIMGFGDLLTNRLLTIDTITMQFTTVNLSPDESCPLCGGHGTTSHSNKH